MSHAILLAAPYTVSQLWVKFLRFCVVSGSGGLTVVSRFITGITHIVNQIIPSINLLTKSSLNPKTISWYPISFPLLPISHVTYFKSLSPQP